MKVGTVHVSRAWVVALVLVLAGLVGGVVCDELPARPAVYRAGYRVLEGDFHAHTSWSDGSLSPLGIVRQADRRGLDVVSVTEHNTALPSFAARAYAKAVDGPVVVTGEEVTTARFHVIALGIEKTVSPDQPLDAVIADIHAQKGVAIVAHPVKHFWADVLPMREKFDGAEVMHPIVYSERSADWRWADMEAYYEESKAPLTAIGSSDYHWMSVLGICRTLVFVREPVTERAVVDAIRDHHTVTLGPDGKPYGDAQLIEALRAEPYVPRTSDYAYRGSSTLDRVLRAMGWLGLAGAVVLRARRRPTPPATASVSESDAPSP